MIATTKRESTNLYDPSACTPARFIYSFRSKAEGKECLGPSSGYLFGEEAFFRLKKELHFGDKNFSRKKTLHISEKTTVVNKKVCLLPRCVLILRSVDRPIEPRR